MWSNSETRNQFLALETDFSRSKQKTDQRKIRFFFWQESFEPETATFTFFRGIKFFSDENDSFDICQKSFFFTRAFVLMDPGFGSDREKLSLRNQ